jgi:hypothetical protein
MEVGASLVADAESFELMQPGEGALDHPAHLAQSGAVGDAASGDQRSDAALPQEAAVLVEVVAPVGVQASGLAAGASAQAPDRRDGVKQGQELGDVMAVAAGERDGEWGSVPVNDQTSDGVKRSSCGSEDGLGTGGEGDGFVVVDALVEAVVQAPDHAIEEITQG